MRKVGESKDVDGALEGVRVGAGEEVEVWISGNGDSFQNDHGSGQEGKIVRHAEREGEEDIVQIKAGN